LIIDLGRCHLYLNRGANWDAIGSPFKCKMPFKQAGGITFAQEESSALFFGMPGSAIKTGCVAFILVPQEIAQELIRISRP